MEWQNIPSWKAPIRTIESSSWIHTEPPKIQILHLRAWLKCFLNCNSLGAVTTLLSNSANACAPSRPAAVGCVISAARCAIEATWPFTRACPRLCIFLSPNSTICFLTQDLIHCTFPFCSLVEFPACFPQTLVASPHTPEEILTQEDFDWLNLLFRIIFSVSHELTGGFNSVFSESSCF